MSAWEKLEEISRDMTSRLKDAKQLAISFGEETITDLALLELKRANPKDIRVFQTGKPLEALRGTDWEWWVGSANLGWIVYNIQAKKLGFKTGRYDQLGHKVAGKPQIKLLETYSSFTGHVPMYCFFNQVGPAESKSVWNCCQSFEHEQMACTLVPMEVVKSCIGKRGARTFSSIHKDKLALPWRCLSKCPRLASLYDTSKSERDRESLALEMLGTTVCLEPALPSWLGQTGEVDVEPVLPSRKVDVESDVASVWPYPVFIAVIEADFGNDGLPSNGVRNDG